MYYVYVEDTLVLCTNVGTLSRLMSLINLDTEERIGTFQTVLTL